MNHNKKNQNTKNSHKNKRNLPLAIISVLGLLVLAIFSYIGYSYNKTTNALSNIPRTNLLPDQSSKNSQSPEPTSTIHTLNSSTATSTKNDTLGKNNYPSKNSHVESSQSLNNNNVETHQSNNNNSNNVDKKSYNKESTVNPQVIAQKLHDDDYSPTKKYSSSSSQVNGVSTIVNDTKSNNINKGAMSFLFMGSDSRNIIKDRGRSDSLMLAYVNKSHSQVYLISFPRDLYVKIPGYDKQKINAAYSYGGSPLTISTIQNFTGLKIQHAAIVNFNSFVNLVDKVGGITVNNPYTGCDNSQKLCWNKGKLNLSSYNALHYVRWRHGLPNGDITRSQNQQAVVKAIMLKSLTPSVIANPNSLSSFINSVSKDVVVDSGLSNSVIMNDIFSLRNIRNDNIHTITAPIAGYYMDRIYGSVDLVNASRMNELRQALANDTMEQYYAKYKNAPVAGNATVK